MGDRSLLSFCKRRLIMRVKTMLLGELGTNVYVVYNEETKEAVVIDPAAEPDKVSQFIEQEQLKLMGMLVTHGHYDHIQAIDVLREQYGVPVFSSKDEGELMKNPELNLSMRFSGRAISVETDEWVRDGDIVEFGDLEFECITVPGHSPESICYYNEAYKVLFSGDTLFPSAIGRTDFYDGHPNTLIQSIKERLLCLPDETQVYSGHGLRTTIGYEKKTNMFLQ